MPTRDFYARHRERLLAAETAERRAAGIPERGSVELTEKRRASKTRSLVRLNAIHTRLRTLRGPAKEQQCIDCGERARNWSLSWRRVPVDDVLFETAGPSQGCPYSLDISHYDSRCVRCAQRYDIGGVGRVGRAERARTHCPQGHLYNEQNTRINVRGARECRACARERSRRFKARKREGAAT